MKILVLGTSAAKPFPRENCQCPICVSKDKKDRRRRSSILINDKFLIDAGPDILSQIEKYKIKDLKATFITHAHKDHTAGLKKMAFQNIPLYLSWISQKILGEKSLAHFRVKIIKFGQKIKIDGLIFQPIKVIHPWIETFAFKITEKKKSFIYMPDYKRIPKKSLPYFKNIDLLIVGGSSLEQKLPWHATIRETIDFFTRFGGRIPKKICFTHIGHATLPHQELVKFVQKEGNSNFNVCFDGRVIKV